MQLSYATTNFENHEMIGSIMKMIATVQKGELRTRCTPSPV
jgi:hypothetical protein